MLKLLDPCGVYLFYCRYLKIEIEPNIETSFEGELVIMIVPYKQDCYLYPLSI